MPVSIPLRFIPPDAENLAKLKVWESSSKDGPFSLIEQTTAIGMPPSWISEYTTDNALNALDWFAISWVDTGGAETSLSSPVQGGTSTLVATLIQRVRERNHSINLHVAQQEAEATIETWFGDATDPYDPTLTVTYRVLNGLTYMVLARTMMAGLVNAIDQATIGLVSYKAASFRETTGSIQQLMAMAERDLGIGGSLVLDMTHICQVYGGQDWRVLRQLLFNDQELAFIPWKPWPIEMAGSRRRFGR